MSHGRKVASLMGVTTSMFKILRKYKSTGSGSVTAKKRKNDRQTMKEENHNK
jgi:hypothetical protein